MKINGLLRRGALAAFTLAAGLACQVCNASGVSTLLDFEGVSDTYNYDGLGFNLGGYYSGLPGGPLFGPQATVLEVGGSINAASYPPASGIGVLWGTGDSDLELTFSGDGPLSVGLYYRSNADLYLFAYDALDDLIGSVSGPDNLAPAAAGTLLFDAGGREIARVLISGPAGAYIIDDVRYVTEGGVQVPDMVNTGWLAGIALAGLVALRRRL